MKNMDYKDNLTTGVKLVTQDKVHGIDRFMQFQESNVSNLPYELQKQVKDMCTELDNMILRKKMKVTNNARMIR